MNTPIELRVGSERRIEEAAGRWRGRILMAVRYGGPDAGLRDADHLIVDVPNVVLGSEPFLEVWLSPFPVAFARRPGLGWSDDGHVLFGCCWRRLGGDSEDDALEIYRSVLTLLDETGSGSFHRVWNYIPAINADERDTERYRRFNAGRARAFEERYGASPERRYPASTAVGTAGDLLITCFIASREPGIHIENPRQVSAYRYPPLYGRRSPSFARGILASSDLGRRFFVSGTSSIVGHETLHARDAIRQLSETLVNVEALLDAATGQEGSARSARHRFALLKSYVRNAADFPAIKGALERRIDPATPVLYILADICRADLMVEIDGVMEIPARGSTASSATERPAPS